MFCSECGSQNEAGVKFCVQCGADLSPQDEKVTRIFGRREKIVGLQEMATEAASDLGHVGKRIATAFLPGQLTDIGLSLLPGEKILHELSIGFLERDVRFWRRNKLILTNQRVISYSRKIIDESMAASHLRDVTGVINGTGVRGIIAAMGAGLLLVGLYSFLSSLSDGNILQGLLAMVLGVIALIFSRRKGLWVTSYNQTLAIEMTRLSITESDEFITALFKAREVFFTDTIATPVQNSPAKQEAL